MVFSREKAVQRALTAKTNVPGTCQKWTREIFGAPSVGDHDKDGDADAVDGWKQEPIAAKRSSRRPPAGVPVAFAGGSRGFGHRAVSLGQGMVRSTDMTPTGYKAGFVGTTTIAQIEKSMGVVYVGWTTTISGIPIPKERRLPTFSRGGRVDHAVDDLQNSKGKGRRKAKIQEALSHLLKIKSWKK